MFTIQDVRYGKYFHYQKRIILFETIEEAQFVLESFLNYSMQRAAQEDPFMIAEIQMTAPHIQICEVRDPAGIQGTFFKDLLEEVHNKRMNN